MDTEVHVAWASSPLFVRRDDARRTLDAVGAAAVASVLDVSPDSVTLTRRCPSCGSREHGVPEVVGSDVLVSLSRATHAGGTVLVAAAVSRASEATGIGVDAEHGSAPTEGLADIVRGAVDGATGALRAWVRVEAVLKATGRGVNIDPGTVTLAGTRVVTPPSGHAGPWALVDVDLAPELVCTVAVEGSSTARVVCA